MFFSSSVFYDQVNALMLMSKESFFKNSSKTKNTNVSKLLTGIVYCKN